MHTDLGDFELVFSAEDGSTAARVREALQNATPKLQKWGGLKEPVRIQLLPTHAHLEKAVNKPGYPWLRAWGRYDEIFLQSPRTWSVFGASQESIDELMVHELTHCLMYQRASDRLGWTRKEIPLWFREGLASYTAEQAYRWMTLEGLARALERLPNEDPLREPEHLYRQRNPLVYGAAHHAVAFLIGRYGEASINALLTTLSQGATFPEAFESVMGISSDRFLDEFRRYLRWRGFR